MTRYAEKTTVSSDKSRAEIEGILTRYGADQFMYGWKPSGAVVAFRAKARHVRFFLPMPDPAERRFTHVKHKGRHWEDERTESRAREAYEQEVRTRWRALALAIKAKLEAVESGITEFEDEFLAHIVLPNGQSMGEHSRALIARAYESGQMPPLLPFLGDQP